MFPGLGSYTPPGPPPPLGPSAAPMPPAQDAPDTGVDPRYRQALDLLQGLLQDEPDDQDSQHLASLIEGLYQIAVDRQKEQDGLVAGKVTPRALRRA